MKNTAKIILIVLGAVAVWISSIAGQVLFARWQNNSNIIIENNPDENAERMFLSSFLPYLEDADVVSLKYSHEGGREPVYIARLKVTQAGMDKIIQNTKTDDHTKYFGFFHSFKSAYPQRLIDGIDWWGFNKQFNYVPQIWDFSDRFVNLGCNMENNEVYIMAVVH
ncbi:MAG: hypothetical protein AB1650_03505 [Candidatus Omnitrophota bacterium]